MKQFLLAGGAALLLAGCSLGLSSKAPPFLLNLVPASVPAADQGQEGAADKAIVVSVPGVPQAIATSRIPVARQGTAIAYLKDAAWVEPPARLFQRVIAETVRAKTGRPVVDLRESGLSNDMLSGQLLRFDIEESSHEAVVVYQATLRRNGNRSTVYRRFEARTPVATIEAAPAGAALNRAANQVAGEVAAWVSK